MRDQSLKSELTASDLESGHILTPTNRTIITPVFRDGHAIQLFFCRRLRILGLHKSRPTGLQVWRHLLGKFFEVEQLSSHHN